MSNKQDKLCNVERWQKQLLEHLEFITAVRERSYDQDTDLKHQHYKNDEQKKKIKCTECPYGGIDCAWCTEDCE